MSGINVVGNTNNNIAAEVEANTKALRTTIRAEDWGSLGIYSVGGSNGTTQMSAGLAANSPIWSFRNGNSSNLIIPKKVILSAACGGTAFTAGAAIFNLYRATSFSASDSAGTQILPGSGGKLRTSMGSSLMTSGNNCDIRIANTVTLTAGTRTKDAQPLGSACGGAPATAGIMMIPPKTPLLDQRVSEYPLVLVQNEGLVLEATVPATGTWFFSVEVFWSELTAY